MSSKPFSNATFTKRVDHEAGRHRPAAAPAEPSVCQSCGARYEHRRWTGKADIRLQHDHELKPALPTICPACVQTAPHGYLSVSGSFFSRHQDDIERLLHNEAERAGHVNPLARIISFEPAGSGLEITTTTEHLAQRLGHALTKAYDGEINYGFSHENKLARVKWHRD